MSAEHLRSSAEFVIRDIGRMLRIGYSLKTIRIGVRISLSFECVQCECCSSNGRKPGENQNVRVDSCIRLIVDEPLPRIRSLRIEGILEFQQASLIVSPE
jgi:hypothetical protein